VEQLEIDQACGILEIDQGILESGVWRIREYWSLESGEYTGVWRI
jgi:hypothetical protein